MNPADLLAAVGEPPGGGLLVALSGGADSALAAWVANKTSGQPVRALHVHHGTRAADELASAAVAVATRLSVPVETVAVDIAAGASWEARARDARWSALFAKVGPADTVVTGHHRDDLAETTLGNLLRGAGTSGLAAMAAPRRDIWRPLLAVTRPQVRALADELELPYTDDPSNDDPGFQRNRIRHQVIPELERLVPNTSSSLARTAGLLAADDAVLERAASHAVIDEDAWGAFTVAAAVVQTAPDPVATRIVRRLLRAANPPYAGSAADVATLLAVVDGSVAAGEVSGGLRAELEGPLLVLHKGSMPPPPHQQLTLPGSAPFGRLEVVAAAAPRVLTRRTSLIAPAATGENVVLRSAAAGDRIEIASGTKLVRDVLAEAGVPARLRPAWPVVEAHARIAAVAAIRSAPWARGRLGDEATIELTVREMQR